MHNGPRGALPSDCPPVTPQDRAFLTELCHPEKVCIDTRRAHECPRCWGRGKLDMQGRAQPVSVYFNRRTSQDCPRCIGAGRVRVLSLDEVCRVWTTAEDFADLVFDPGGISAYRPSLDVRRAPELRALADAYDKAQEARGDSRRAYRG